MAPNDLHTFGDVRRMILETVADLKNGKMSAAQGMAIAANFKVLNDSVQVEINAAKLSLLTEDRAHNFGRLVGMGTRLIGSDGGGS
jgi:hypothetical protein